MQFQLPANLREQVAIYDPALKPLIIAQKRAASGAKKKSQYPLGLPDCMLPVEVLSKDAQIQIVKGINTKAAQDRHFRGSTDGYEYLIYHHESLWIAAWVPTSYDSLIADDVPYIYGFTVAHKSAPSTASKISNVWLSGYSNQRVAFTEREQMQEVKFGRTAFLIRSKQVTLADIQNGEDRLGYIHNLSSWGNSHDKYMAAKGLTDAITSRIPCWTDRGSSIFERIADKDKSVIKLIARYSALRTPGDATFEDVEKTLSDSPLGFIKTPYFRREIQRVTETSNQLFHDINVKDSDKVAEPYKLLRQQTKGAIALSSIYGENVPLDYLQRMYEIAKHVEVQQPQESICKWIAANVPIASFVGWYEKHYTKTIQEWERDPNQRERMARFSSTGEPEAYFHELRDTLHMMWNLYNNQCEQAGAGQRDKVTLELEPPSRWRLSELHDHVSAKLWTASNRNEDLPQDLFPAPIKIDHLGSRWTFFQPKDIHQLGQWGQAVRNCVGNASNYREGVKKRSHFIVLAMVDQKPRFTVQLKVRNGVMDVDQIADVANRRLDDTDRASYELTFSMALKVREAQLTAQAEANV